MMKRIVPLILFTSLGLVLTAAATAPERTDINPALLYWQAFAVMPDLPVDDQGYLFDTDWRTRAMDARAGQLADKFDSTFRLLRQAGKSTVPCDWGVDLKAGPQALLPHLAKAKRCVQAATLRSRWFGQQNRQAAACADLAAAFILGRNLARDGVLISDLVQIAIENIVLGHIVQQWPHLETASLASLLTAFDAAPPRVTIADCMRTEKVDFYGWLVRKVTELQAAHPSDDPQGLKLAEDLITGMVSEEGQSRRTLAADVMSDAGNSLSGLLRYVQQMEPFYDRVEQAMQLPYQQFQPRIEQIQQQISIHTNLLLHEFFPAFAKVRLKEFRVQARLAMVKAAYQYRINPSDGLRHVPDPFGAGPFEFTRFVLDGKDRGFELKSHLKTPDFDEAFIFAETPGPAFYIDGPPVGQKIH